MSTTKYNRNLLIFRELLPPPISRDVNTSPICSISPSLLHQAFAFCGRGFCISLLVLLPLVSCDREDAPVGQQGEELQVDTTWTDVYDYDYEGNPIDKDVTIPLPDDTAEEGDAGEAV